VLTKREKPWLAVAFHALTKIKSMGVSGGAEFSISASERKNARY
jgi:hypothetical protein